MNAVGWNGLFVPFGAQFVHQLSIGKECIHRIFVLRVKLRDELFNVERSNSAVSI